MADIFLSYAKEDRASARAIAKLLESCGWSVFWDRKIVAGDDWRQVVQAELDAAGAVVVLWSCTSVASTWVLEEAERGRTRLVSVLIADAPLPIGFGTVQGINLVGWTGGRAEDVTLLIDGVARILQRPPQQPPRIPASAARRRAVAVSVGLAVVLGAGGLWMRSLSAPAPWINQEIVLDTSADMKNDFDGKPSKLSAAVAALQNRVMPDADNLALRAFGGACRQDDESRLLVPFGTSRRHRIERASSGLEPRGQSTLLSAVLAALADIQPLAHTRRIIVITGHADQCYEEALRELKERFDAQPKVQGKDPVVLEMRFIGLSVPASDKPQIQQLSNTVGGQAYFVSTVSELNDVLQYVLEFEPAAAHVRNVWNIVDEVGKSLSATSQNMNAEKFDEATSILDAGQARYAEMRQSFDSLAELQPSVNFKRFYKLAVDNRVLQERAFAAGRAIIRGGALPKDRQSSAYEGAVKKRNELIAAWNDIVGKYNANINEMNQLTDQIVKEARRTG